MLTVKIRMVKGDVAEEEAGEEVDMETTKGVFKESTKGTIKKIIKKIKAGIQTGAGAVDVAGAMAIVVMDITVVEVGMVVEEMADMEGETMCMVEEEKKGMVEAETRGMGEGEAGSEVVELTSMVEVEMMDIVEDKVDLDMVVAEVDMDMEEIKGMREVEADMAEGEDIAVDVEGWEMVVVQGVVPLLVTKTKPNLATTPPLGNLLPLFPLPKKPLKLLA